MYSLRITVEMEELLQDIFKEAGPKLLTLKKACQDALEVLCLQESTKRCSSHELRQSCLLPLQMALETKRARLINFGINGFHKIIRDDRFHRGIEPEDDSLWLPSQLLCATASVMYQLPETQVQIFRMYLSLALSPRRTLNGRLCVWICGRCAEAAGCTAPVAAAAKAAAAQTIRAYCTQLDEEYQELLSESSPLGKSRVVAVGCYSEIIPVIQYLCGRLSEAQVPQKQNPQGLFFLDCLLTLISSLSDSVSGNSHFTTFLWQKFCPSLISFLGTPRVDKNFKTREHDGNAVDDSGRGSGALVSAPNFNCKQAKAIYSIANQLVRLVGPTPNLRPVLEALYHRMLLYPPVINREEPLRSVRELLQNPKRLMRLVLTKSGDVQECHSDDMAILRLIMDGIEECGQSCEPSVLIAAVECVVGLLDALQKLCAEPNDFITEDVAKVMMKRWPTLQDADYSGPLTYQTLARLPSPYRDVVAVLQCAEEKEVDSSDTSGPENASSGSDGEADSDVDNVFLPSRANQPSTACADSDTSTRAKGLPKTFDFGRNDESECNVDLERHNARQFVKTLQNNLIPKLMNLRTCIEVDEAMQEFASKCCEHNALQPPATTCIMNADGVYLATYAALLLNLQLKRTNYYNEPNRSLVPTSEEHFVTGVQTSGGAVWAAGAWLREVYQRVLQKDLLHALSTANEQTYKDDCALVHLLSDLGGLDQNPIMSDWQKLKEVSMIYNNAIETPQQLACFRWARRILTCIWDSMVEILSIPLMGYRSKKQKIHGIISKKLKTFGKRKRAAWEALTIQCLEGLHKAARVSNTLHLQNRCSHILGLLAKSAVSEPPNGKILSTHALSLDILITGGLELGSKAPECWEHIFTACQYVSSLEHSLFGQQGNNATTLVTMQMGRNKPVSMIQADAKLGLEAKDDETCVDVFNFLQPAFGNTSSNEMSVSQIVESCRQEGGNMISGASAARVCCVLSASADALFSRLASTATLPAARAALRRLERYQQRALFSEWTQDVTNNNVRWWRRNSTRLNNVGEACRSICRMGDLALRCLKSTRPLAHRMAIWAIVGPHFMQVACHKDIQISSLAIQCLHDCITTLLNQQVELPHFHFNEALLKPFENLLCLELCDDDIQEQIIACICELVETNRLEIRSGWRPLFNTLRAANNANQYSALLEIFRVFLNTDNTLVFANAALDCILCLLSHIKGLNTEETTTAEVKSKKQATNPSHLLSLKFSKNSKFIPFNEEKTENVKVDMCKEALHHLENCAEILAMMYNMPKCPVFNTGNRIKGDLPLSLVDPIIPSNSLDVTKFISNDYIEADIISYRKLSTSLPDSNTTNNCLLKLDKPSNIIKVWYILIEGLISATVVCSKKNQPAAMETLFKILKNTYEVPGSHFGLHCINHLLLPAVQNWLRQTSHNNPSWDNVLPNFKQCCGMTTDLFVFYLHQLQDINFERFDKETKKEIIPFESPEVTLALKQIMLILVECIAQPQEPVARLGASCIRHIILTSGQLLTNHQWAVICTSLHRACNVCLTPLKQLTYAFKENSLSFYGDLAIVKVAARRDCTVNDNVRLHAMAQQVFLNEAKTEKHSKLTPKNSAQNLMLIDDRSYIFLIYVQDPKSVQYPEFYTIRIPHRGLVVGLLAHQILVQIIATIFIQASSDVFRGINSIFLESLKTGSNDCNQKFYLNQSNTEILVKALDLSYLRAMQFDSRPGLKFLVQKVSNLDYAANLYKQTTSSWLVKVIALTETFFKGAFKFKLISTDISIILQQYTTSTNLTLEYDTFVSKIFELKNTWEWLCNSYVKQIINVTDFDEPEVEKRVSCSSIETDKSSNVDEYYTNENADVDNGENISHDENQRSEEHTVEDKSKDDTSEHQPFTFADFKKQSQSSTSDENNHETNIEKEASDKISVSEEKLDESPEKLHKTKIDTIQNSYKAVYNGTTKDFNFPDTKINEITTKDVKANETHNNEVVTETTNIESAAKRVNIAIADKSSANVHLGSINGEPVPPPQPVPPEIEQQRTLSISKDKEVQRNCFQNILLAYLELVLTFPADRFTLINPVLKPGFLQLAQSVTDPLLVERISIFLEK